MCQALGQAQCAVKCHTKSQDRTSTLQNVQCSRQVGCRNTESLYKNGSGQLSALTRHKTHFIMVLVFVHFESMISFFKWKLVEEALTNVIIIIFCRPVTSLWTCCHWCYVFIVLNNNLTHTVSYMHIFYNIVVMKLLLLWFYFSFACFALYIPHLQYNFSFCNSAFFPRTIFFFLSCYCPP